MKTTTILNKVIGVLFLIAMLGVFSQSAAAALGDFTIIVLPDTQNYATSYPAVFTNQTKWIVSQKDALNIQYVTQEGDLVNTPTATEYNNANASMSILENPATTSLPDGIPYGVAPGNHDSSAALYEQYFGAWRFQGRAYYGGHYGSDNENMYVLFEESGLKFIAINLEFGPSSSVLSWADSLLKNYSDRRAILTSHSMLNVDGSWTTEGTAIYAALKNNPNLFMMLGGHMHSGTNSEAMRTETYNGNTMYVLFADFQDYTNGGNGFLRIMSFVPTENKIYVKTYSPYVNQYETDSNSQFSLDYNMGNMNISVDYPSVTLDSPANSATVTSSPVIFSCTSYDNVSLENVSLYLASGGSGGSGTASVRVSQSSDDAEEFLSSHTVGLTSTDLELINDTEQSGAQEVGMRFQNVNIPQGATITNAHIEFEVDETGSTITSLSIYGQDSDNAATFTTSNNDVTSRAKTSASAAWNDVPAWSTADEKKQTPDISSVIQEIVDRTGWASGNSLALIITGTGKRVAEAYDGESANAPLLVVEYEAEESGMAWHAAETKAISGTESSATFSAGLADGSYVWNCFACDTQDNCNFAAANRTLTVNTAVVSGWIAYNDMDPRVPSGSTANAPYVTEYSYDTASGVLKDFETGVSLPVTMTGSYNTILTRTEGENANSGTEAANVFGASSGRIVDLRGVSQLQDASNYATITFNNLDPTKEYAITLSTNRDDVSYANIRYTKVTIEGADEYMPASSSGVVVNSASSVSFSTGYNTVNGYVAKWTGVTSGPDGSFSIKSEWDSTQGSGTDNTKGYAMSAFKLEEVEEQVMELQIASPTTASPVSVSGGETIPVAFNFFVNGAAMTSGVTLSDILIGGQQASAATSDSCSGTLNCPAYSTEETCNGCSQCDWGIVPPNYNSVVMSFSPDYRWMLSGNTTDSVDSASSDGGRVPNWVANIVPNGGASQCGDFNGTSTAPSVAYIPDKDDINVQITRKKSISMWIVADTIDTTGNGRLIWRQGGATTSLAIYVLNVSGMKQLHFTAIEGSNRDYCTYNITTGQLYHVVAVMDANATPAGFLKLYVNGNLVSSDTSLAIGSDFTAHPSGDGAIGGYDTGENSPKNYLGNSITGFFDGRISDVVYYAEQAVLTAANVSSIYNAGMGIGGTSSCIEISGGSCSVCSVGGCGSCAGCSVVSSPQFVYIPGTGWQAQVITPSGLTGLQDLFVSAAYGGNARDQTQSSAVNYGSAVGCTVPEDCAYLNSDCAVGICNSGSHECEQTFKAPLTECRGYAGTCDLPEYCSGDSASCPTDSFLPSGITCKDTQGVCDAIEYCSGTTALCPADAKSTGQCRNAAGACDVAESCDGISNDCPADAKAPAATSCADGLICDGNEVCDGNGICLPGSAVDCMANNKAEIATCTNSPDDNQFTWDYRAAFTSACKEADGTCTLVGAISHNLNDVDADGYASTCGDCNDAVAAVHPGATEVCNGIDDNCNGFVDEGVLNTYYQDADGDSYGSGISILACSAPAGYVAGNTDCDDSDEDINPGADEVCNGVDDDCIAATADGSDESWIGDTCDGADSDVCEEGVYQCSAGAQSCTDATGDNIDVCNGLDDDCDESIDEDFPNLGDACDVGIGECQAFGAYICKADETGTRCNAVAGTPGAELCNNLDDDCDGSIADDGVGESWYNAATSCGKGVCAAAGTFVCQSGAKTNTCVAGAPTGTDNNCNGVDENCDGTVDNNYVPVTSCFLPGACAAGNVASSCNGGAETACATGSPTGTDNNCNGVDENCNGVADENYVPTGTTCGVGACASTGTTSCVAGGVVDSCIAGTPGTETCNGLDDDCDGSTDESLTQPTTCGVGACAGNTGIETCTAGTWGGNTCNPYAGATAEVCEGSVDENCDGAVDEGCGCANGATQPCGSTDVGECQYGLSTCSGGAWGACIGNVEPTAELCDGSDNDCDASTDEDFAGLGDSCTAGVGKCLSSGNYVCKADGSGTECSAVAGSPSAELCNGLDDDCDGSIADDGVGESWYNAATSCGQGVCASTGNFVCQSGAKTNTCVAGSPTGSDNNCNGVDENCDGTADNNYAPITSCFLPGVCASGNAASTCVAGTETSCATGSPTGTDNNCNGVDENCNGQADENYVPTGTTCGVGACASTGTTSCVAGGVVDSCVVGTPASSDATCDGIDNNCNGQVDEGYTPITSCFKPGACAAGNAASTCIGGVETACKTGASSAEICGDGIDNDCDGLTDLGDTDCQQCTTDAQCSDGAYCNGAEVCNLGTYTCQAGTPPNCNDGSECTQDTCDESADKCVHNPVAENTACTNGICCAGLCRASSCSADANCNDNNACTIDACTGAGTCGAACTHTTKTVCANGDGCCPAGCTNANDNDCQSATQCWEGDNKNLAANNVNQFKKFCKCADGNYSYSTVLYNWGFKPSYQYLDAGNNVKWNASSVFSYSTVYKVKCSNMYWYNTSQDYYYSAAPACTSDANCSNNLYCDGTERCVSSVCTAGTPVGCSDGVSCTVDSCDETNDRCVSAADNSKCNAGYYCNVTAGCQKIGQCAADADCSDGAYCNGAEKCDLSTYTCKAGTAPNCSALGNQCNLGVCNEAADACQAQPANEGNACNDGLFCNEGETCQAGTCKGGSAKVCGDSVSCTVDSCDETNDNCKYTPTNSLCDNGLFCDGAETCNALSGCQAGTPPSCNDGSECTQDTCNSGTNSCKYTPVAENTACANGICCAGLCRASSCSADANCNDNNACTIDACTGAGTCGAACTHTAKTVCANGDGCCPAGCTSANDNDCQSATQCWEGDNKNIVGNINQFKKFCKCADGAYAYTGVLYNPGWGFKTSYQYTDAGNNANWAASPAFSYFTAYSVKCSNLVWYNTNVDYYK